MVLSFKFVCALFQFSELSPLLGRGRSCACVSKLQMRGEGLIQRKIERNKVCCNAPTCSCSAQGKCHDAQSQKLEFLPSLEGEGGRRPDGVNSLVPSHTARSKCHDAQSQEQFTPVMLNLFQHLTSLACNLFADKILKQVQDDIIKNPCNEHFNLSTFQPFNCLHHPIPTFPIQGRS